MQRVTSVSEGLRIIKVASSDVKSEACDDRKSLTSGTGDKAYPPDVRRSSRGRKKSTLCAVCWIGSPHALSLIRCWVVREIEFKVLKKRKNL